MEGLGEDSGGPGGLRAPLSTSLTPTWGTDQAWGSTLGVTFTKKGLSSWGAEGRGQHGYAEQTSPNIPQPCPQPSSHRLAKLRKASRRRSQRCEKADSPCYICMTIFLYFSEQTSVVYVPVCPDSLAPLFLHSLCCDLTSSS